MATATSTIGVYAYVILCSLLCDSSQNISMKRSHSALPEEPRRASCPTHSLWKISDSYRQTELIEILARFIAQLNIKCSWWYCRCCLNCLLLWAVNFWQRFGLFVCSVALCCYFYALYSVFKSRNALKHI